MNCIGCKQPPGLPASQTRWKCSFQELSDGSAAGCDKCTFVLAICDCLRRDLKTERSPLTAVVLAGSYVLVSGFRPGPGILVEIFGQKSESENPLGIRNISRRLPGHTQSAETLKSIRSWIESCANKHPGCRPPSSRPRLSPRRLLDITNGSVVLREHPNPQRYACLSHCWGSGAYVSIVKTTVATLDEFMTRGIPWDSLTKTFQDTITLCRALDMSHIWIDSMCIIQDSDADWREQAAQMADIYANAFLTVAASRASDGSMGLFTAPDPVWVGTPVPSYGDTYVRQMIPAFPTYNSTDLFSPEWPLISRGWVYQEMQLSARVLSFGPIQAVWKCRQAEWDETGRDKQAGYDDDEAGSSNNWGTGSAKDPAKYWHRVIEEYAGLKLTFASDRMIALSAVTKRMEEKRAATKDRYLAGLWEKTFLDDVAWMVVPASLDKQPKSGHLPSWSWASVSLRVMYRGPFTAKLARVHEVSYAARGPSHLGDAAEAAVTLEAILLDVSRLGRHFPPEHAMDTWDLTDHIQVRKFMPDSGAGDPLPVPDGLPDGSRYVVPIGINTDYDGTPDVPAILVGKKEGSNNLYERIGFVKLGVPNGNLKYEKSMKEELTERLVVVFGSLPKSHIILV
ncbi:heterokaryon incompatibility protein-domain-containing protein [Lasiosphaeris hirsuta]|uniref:Heterokaryon incompatibility protein-domain-containing protein n=1 Tax=Lasiosphaeris hirsuta TaxID=260670 RepID=A0AA40AG31_9PEZI|nr:heterokaryon incompatibility protein-domain-containing protein [Lasiosphaeris hirsuta]